MADQEFTTRINVEGNAESAFKGAAKAADAYEAEAKSAADATEKSSTKFTELRSKLELVEKAYGALKGVVGDSVRKFADYQAELGRVERQLGRVGASSDALGRIQARVTQRSRELGVSNREQLEGYRRLIAVTQDVTEAERLMTAAVNVSAAENMDLMQAVELLRKARNGEVEELKNLEGITKDQAEVIGRMPDLMQRYNTAMEVIEKRYSGAAKELKGVNEELRSFEENINLIERGLGDFSVELAKTFTGEEGKGVFDKIADGASKSGEALREFKKIIDGISDASAMEIIESIASGESAMDLGLRMQDRRAREQAIIDDLKRQRGFQMGMPTAPDVTTSDANVAGGVRGNKKAKPPKKKPSGKAPEPARSGFEGDFDDPEIQTAFALETNMRAFGDSSVEIAETFKDAWSDIGDAFSPVADKIGSAADAMQGFGDQTEEVAQKVGGFTEGQQTALDAVQAAGQGVANVAQQLGAPYEIIATIRGTMETAEAIAAGVAGNIPKAIGHGFAATQFFIAAGQAASGSTGGVQKGGGGGGASRAVQTAQAQFGGNERDASSRTTILNFRKVGAVTEDEGRILRRAVESDNRDILDIGGG